MIRKIFWLSIKFILLLILSSIIFVGYIFYICSHDLPDHNDLKDHQHIGITRIYDNVGSLLAEYAIEKRIFVPIDKIPKKIIEAFLSSEDKNFYQHQGIDFVGLARLPVVNLMKLFSRQRMQGASTITQQVVKNLLLTNEYSITRKIKEAILSYKISQELSKDQILELYLNHSYLGKGSYGIAAAAKIYFDKSLEELSIAQIAFLASLPKAPSFLSNPKNYLRVKNRRDYVLNQMLENEFITKEENIKAKAEDIIFTKNTAIFQNNNYYFNETIREEVSKLIGEDNFYNGGLSIFTSLDPSYQSEAEKILIANIDKYEKQKNILVFDRVNSREEFFKYKFQNNQMLCLVVEVKANTIKVMNQKKQIIHLNFDTAFAENIIDTNSKTVIFSRNKIYAKSFKDILKPNDLILLTQNNSSENNIFEQSLYQEFSSKREFKSKNTKNNDYKEIIDHNYKIAIDNKLNGAIVVMNYLDGRILAMVGGYSFTENKFNRVTQANRQIGSLVKIFIYLAALEQGIEPEDVFSDQPMDIVVGNQVWRPKNYGNKFLGDVTMQESFEKSRNLSTLRIVQKLGLNKLIEILKRFNIHQNPPKFLPIALGAIESTLLKVTNAVASIANDGRRVNPSLIDVIKDQNGKVIYLRDNQKCINNCNHDTAFPDIVTLKGEKMSDEASVYQIQTLLNGVIKYESSQKSHMTLGGKTGTTNESKDVWFVGFSKKPNIVFGSYLGYDLPKSLGQKVTGGSLVKPMFIEFMQSVYNLEMKKYSDEIFHINTQQSVTKDSKDDILYKLEEKIEKSLTKDSKKNKKNKINNYKTALKVNLLSENSKQFVYMNGKFCLKLQKNHYYYNGHYPLFTYFKGKTFSRSIFDLQTRYDNSAAINLNNNYQFKNHVSNNIFDISNEQQLEQQFDNEQLEPSFNNTNQQMELPFDAEIDMEIENLDNYQNNVGNYENRLDYNKTHYNNKVDDNSGEQDDSIFDYSNSNSVNSNSDDENNGRIFNNENNGRIFNNENDGGIFNNEDVDQEKNPQPYQNNSSSNQDFEVVDY